MDKKQRDFMNFMAFMAMVEEQKKEEQWTEEDDEWFEDEDEDEWLEDEDDEWYEPVVPAAASRSINTVVTETKPVQAETFAQTKPATTTSGPLTKEERLLNSIQMPEKPENKMDSGSKFVLFFGILGLIDAVFGILMGNPFFVVVGIVIGISFIIMALSDSKKNYEEELAEYELAQRDFPAYQRKMVAKQKEKEMQEIRRRNKRW